MNQVKNQVNTDAEKPAYPETIGYADAAQAAPEIDLDHASTAEIKAEIGRTRMHMDEHLSQLGDKLKTKASSAYLWIPIGGLLLGAIGYAAFRMVGKVSKPKKWSDRVQGGVDKFIGASAVEKLQVRSAGIFDQIRMLRLAVSAARKGKPAIYIVEPRKR